MHDEIIQKMALELRERKVNEKRIDYDCLDAATILDQCRKIGKPYYSGDGQFTGGYSTERYDHPTDPERKVGFEFEDGELIECYTWVPYKNYPYPI